MSQTKRTKNEVRAIADTTSGTILAVVEIEAPPQRVYEAITKDVASWWGSADSYKVIKWEADLTVGGRWTSTGVGGDGKEFSINGTYLELSPFTRVVHTWEAPWDGFAKTTVRYQLDPLFDGAATRVTLRHDGFEGRAESCSGHAEGWQRVLGWLGAYAAAPVAEAVAEAPKMFLCRLVPPRATFPGDMTKEEAEAMGKHAAYWREHAKGGCAWVVGPVADPKGAWGLAIIQAPDDAAAGAVLENDPVVRANLGFRFERLPMMSAILRS
jgi:uncharacterized protein YndB with AHSA1/START domain